jgi:hypothetical protein
MASRLDPVPKRENRHSLAKGFARAVQKKSPSSELATFEQYQEMIEDRPPKFQQDQVNYREADGEEQCSRCVHYFIGAVAGRNVCEILRTVPEESIEPDWVCDFVTADGETFPLLGKKGGSDEKIRP